MSLSWFTGLLIVAVVVIAMEGVAYAVHRYVMHGVGWAWHRSHHEPRNGWFEKNDLYALLFAGLSLALFIAGDWGSPIWWVGAGTAAYGVLYTLLHDGIVHRRLPLRVSARGGYLQRLVQAHRLHHAVREREGAVSFGFLYAPPVRKLKRELRMRQGAR